MAALVTLPVAIVKEEVAKVFMLALLGRLGFMLTVLKDGLVEKRKGVVEAKPKITGTGVAVAGELEAEFGNEVAVEADTVELVGTDIA